MVGVMLSACTDSTGPDAEVEEREIEYMTFSIDHHAAGVLVASVCVERAVNADLRALCQENVADQNQEIEQLRGWLQEWYGETHEPEIEPSQVAMVAQLRTLSGGAFEIAFMEHFIEHHAMIVERSREVLSEGMEHMELREMASMIIQVQSENNGKMDSWLCLRYQRC